MASYLHRTATTTYPCCLPALGDSAGAGRIRLAGAKIGKCAMQNPKYPFHATKYPFGPNEKWASKL